jgi:hypothetical protein
MKSVKQIWLGLVLVMITALIFSGCGKKDNPFEPSSDAVSGSRASNLTAVGDLTISPALGGSLADLKPDSSGIQGEIVIVFADYMEASTINLTNIEVEGIGTSGVIKYYPEVKKAVIQGTWTNNNYYKITFKSGVRNKGGMPIDGNGNDEFDGSPYDDHVTYFLTGAPTGSAPDLVHPHLMSAGPFGGNQTRWPLMYVGFDTDDIDTTLVKSNFSVRDSAGNLVSIRLNWAAWSGYWYVTFNPENAVDSLDYNTLYTVTVNVGALADTNGNKVIWDTYGYIANVPNLVWSFRTVGQSGDYTPLHYSSHGTPGAEMTVTFDDSLDMSTINSTNVKIYRLSGSGGSIVSAVSGRIYAMPDDIAARRFHFTLENAPAGNYYRLYLSRRIKDNAGLFLDGNNNGDPAVGVASDDVIHEFYK